MVYIVYALYFMLHANEIRKIIVIIESSNTTLIPYPHSSNPNLVHSPFTHIYQTYRHTLTYSHTHNTQRAHIIKLKHIVQRENERSKCARASAKTPTPNVESNYRVKCFVSMRESCRLGDGGLGRSRKVEWSGGSMGCDGLGCRVCMNFLAMA